MIEKAELINILEDWNLWSHEIETGIIRETYLKNILPYIERKEILAIKGIRRSGKSTLMKQIMQMLLKKGIKKEQLLYLNLEDFRLKKFLSIELLEFVLNTYLEYTKNKKKIFFFIDEIHSIPKWETWIRTKYDLEKNIKFIITGSNASLLSKELSTLLTGRNLTFNVNVLSYKEYLYFNKKGSILEYLEYGGFPEVVLEKDKLKKRIILQQYFEDIINKDIISRYKIRNTELLKNLASFILENSGNKISYNLLGKSFGVTDDTISTYISYMIDAFLISKVPFFTYSLKKRHGVIYLPKFYALDNGLISISNISKNFGRKLENAIFLKLFSKGKEIFYYSEKNEVDFIFDNNAINVTFDNSIKEREILGLIEFKRKYKKYNLILINQNINEEGEIKKIPYEKFLYYFN
ncbi:MAG: ATP-binding protein [Candidatus Woesearchaeota archaeon]